MQKHLDKILILGTLPPPVGGVTVHIQRLLALLNEEKIPYTFCHIRESSFLSLLKQFLSHNFIHLHISNIPLSFFFALICCVFQKKLVLTRHGDINRHRGWLYHIDLWAIQLATIPILLNQTSYRIANKYNRNARLISAFLPPSKDESLPEELITKLMKYRKKYKYIFATNAYNISFDEGGNEIYGISSLIKIFRKHPDLFLVAATCNKNYYNYLSVQKVEIPENVFLIQKPISFFSLLKLVDGMIRHTTTDGDALSVREALYLQKRTFATDCVPRPQGTICYHNIDELEKLLETVNNDICLMSSAHTNGKEIIDIYRSLLRS